MFGFDLRQAQVFWLQRIHRGIERLTTLGYAYCGGNQGGGPCYAYTEAGFSPASQNAALNLSADLRVIYITNDVFGGATFSVSNFPNHDDFQV